MLRTVAQYPPVVVLPDVEIVQRQLTSGQDVIELRTQRADRRFLTVGGSRAQNSVETFLKNWSNETAIFY